VHGVERVASLLDRAATAWPRSSVAGVETGTASRVQPVQNPALLAEAYGGRILAFERHARRLDCGRIRQFARQDLIRRGLAAGHVRSKPCSCT